MGNRGIFNKQIQQILADTDLVLHVGYLILCIMGLFMHPFFFSVLVIMTFMEDAAERFPDKYFACSSSTSWCARRRYGT